MTAIERFERELPAYLAELLAGPAPDYRDAILLVTRRTRQRASWTFPERWLPMQAEGLFRSNVPPLPWRALGVLALLAAMLVGALLLAGNTSERPPIAPFGPAPNGRIAVATEDGVLLLDPASGATTRLFAGTGPLFSPDGRQIVFFPHDAAGRFEGRLAVANADGSGTRLLEPALPEGAIGAVVWAPDSRFLLYTKKWDVRVLRYDSTGSHATQELGKFGHATLNSFRPPDGRQAVFMTLTPVEYALKLVDLTTGVATVLHTVPIGPAGLLVTDDSPWSWSPDGSQLAMAVPGAEGSTRIVIVSADGSARRNLTDAAGTVREEQPQYSPDGRWILFRRSTVDARMNWVNEGWSVARADGAEVIDIRPGVGRDSGGAVWSPDGRFVFVNEERSSWRIVDLQTGAVRSFSLKVRSPPELATACVAVRGEPRIGLDGVQIWQAQ